MNFINKKYGFTLMEVIIALMILSLGLVSIFSLFGGGTRSLHQGTKDVSISSCANTIFSELSSGTLPLPDPLENQYNQVRSSIDPKFKYDLEFIPLDSLDGQIRDASKNAVLVTLTIKWNSGSTDQSEKFQTIILK